MLRIFTLFTSFFIFYHNILSFIGTTDILYFFAIQFYY